MGPFPSHLGTDSYWSRWTTSPNGLRLSLPLLVMPRWSQSYSRKPSFQDLGCQGPS
ncbi:unnamed protein product [Rhodiola kirilowii]